MIIQSDNRLRLIRFKYLTITGIVLAVNLNAIADVKASDADYNFLIDSDWHNCQQISSEYQEVYAFETPSFYVNICQKNDVYFYSGEAKQSHTSSIFVTATPLGRNRGFQAHNGNVSYTVILPFPQQDSTKPSALNRGEAILTIKRNQQLIAVESSLTKYCHPADAIALDEMKLYFPRGFDRVATIPQQHVGVDLLSRKANNLPLEVFAVDSRFDFYRLDGKLHRLATCN